MSSDPGQHAWRPIFAALGNADTRTVYARVVLQADDPASGLSPSRRRHAIEALRRAGLIDESDGRLVATEDAFAAVLRAAPRPVARSGVDRFLTPDGRIDTYPATATDRRELWDHVARSITPDEVLTESELNDRLARFHDDVAALRRHLVDDGVLERPADGSRYRRQDTPG
ncbi:MAG TPA: DUF2087 domain-containing protein [Candidatus Limnocylindrales bacterium]